MQDLQKVSVRISWTLLAPVVFSFLMLLVTALVLFSISRAGTDADRRVVHTLEAKQQIAALLTTIMSAEAGQRGFLFTGQEDFLVPYEAARESVPLQLDDLRERVRDNSVQVARIAALQPIIAERLATIEETLTLARQNQRPAAAQIVRTRGERLMDDIRQRIAQIDATESQLLLQRRANVARIRNQFLSAVAAMLVACGILTVFALISVRRYLVALNENRRQLAAYNTELEARVAQRTEALAEAAELAAHERSRAEALLTDVNHRVGNNLALVSSFLTMQERAVTNPEAVRALSAARARVQAIASAQRKLRLGADFATVKADEVLGAVLEDICAGLPPGDLIRVNYQFAPLEIHARDAVSLGVLTSELVMNAVKHAFSAGQSGEVNVIFSNTAAAPFLEVTDDGVGWHERPRQDLSSQASDGQTNEDRASAGQIAAEQASGGQSRPDQSGAAGMAGQNRAQDGDGLGARIIDMVAAQFGGKPERLPLRGGNARPGTRIRIELARLQLMQSC